MYSDTVARSMRQLSVDYLLKKVSSSGFVLAVGIFVIIFVVYVFSAPAVLTVSSITNLLIDTAALAVAAMGLTFVIIVGGYDLSIGGVAVLANVIIATHSGTTLLSGAISVVVALAAGLFVGVINGVSIAYLGVQSIAATLGTMIMCSGVALLIMPQPGGSVPSFIAPGLTTSVGGVLPVAVVVIGLSMAAWAVVRRSRFGAYVYAVGADERAAAQSGIATRKVRFRVYALAGLIYAVAGILLTAQMASGDPNGSALFLVLVFAAVAIGGAKFGGGRGSAIGSIFGAGVLAVLQKTLFALGVSSFYTSVVQGVVLIVAVLIGLLSAKLANWGSR